jgi:hypothetical protein
MYILLAFLRSSSTSNNTCNKGNGFADTSCYGRSKGNKCQGFRDDLSDGLAALGNNVSDLLSIEGLDAFMSGNSFMMEECAGIGKGHWISFNYARQSWVFLISLSLREL